MTTTHPTSAPHAPRRHPATSPGTPARRAHPWRWVAGTLVVLVALFAGAAWYFSGRIESGALTSTPASFPPRFDDVRVVSVDDESVTLARGPDASENFDAPGIYGLAWEGGTGLLGPASPGAGDTVVRSLEVVTGSPPAAGQMAAVDRAYWLGDPEVTMGLETTEVVVGDGLPAWFFPAAGTAGSTTAIVVHGQNGSRLDGLRPVDVLHGVGVPVLDITYRNDLGAPADPSGRLQFGVTEWQDLDAAVTWAREQGADDIVLVGQSMGGAVVASFLENSAQADVVSKVVLDAPMLSLDDVVSYGARDALPVVGGAVPEPVLWAARQFTTLRFGVDWAAVDYLDDTSWVTVPTLVVHGVADPTVPLSVSEDLAAAEPDLVTLEAFPQALHVESWNVSRERYTQLVGSFVAPTG